MFAKFFKYSFISALIILIISNCKETPTGDTYNITNYGNPLTNPDSMPRIIFTNPANGAMGPFGVVDPTLNQSSPRITIQFNKLINVFDINDKNITLKSGDESYNLTLLDSYYYQSISPNLRDILIFNISTKYLANKNYILTVDTTLQDIHGYVLSKKYEVSYTPEPYFRVFHVSPSDDNVEPRYYYPGGSEISVEFNSQVDSTIFSSLSVTPALDGKWVLADNYYGYNYFDSTIVNFMIKDTLMFEKEYTVSVSGDAHDINNLPIKKPYQFSFTTAPFGVSWSGASYSNTSLNYVTFTFNGPVDTSTVRSSISVTPELKYELEYYSQDYPIDQMRLSFYDAVFTPNTTYEIKLDKTIRAITGNYLKEPYIYTYTTSN